MMLRRACTSLRNCARTLSHPDVLGWAFVLFAVIAIGTGSVLWAAITVALIVFVAAPLCAWLERMGA